MVLNQILRDLRKEWSWALFYTIVTTMTLIAVMSLTSGFSLVLKERAAVNRFIDQNVVMFRYMNTAMEPNAAHLSSSTKQPDTINPVEYIQHGFSDKGKAGSYVFVSNTDTVRTKYDQILILFGQYGQLAGFKNDTPVAAYIPEQDRDDSVKTITVGQQEIPIAGTIDPQFGLFHPYNYFDAENLSTSELLILCTEDIDALNDIFYPWWNFYDNVFERMVLVNPTEEEVNELQDVYYATYGKFYQGIPVRDFARNAQFANWRSHGFFLLFFVLAGILLIPLLILNIVRMIEANITEYTIHHMYGAPIRLIQRRVGGFVIALNIIPIAGLVYILGSNRQYRTSLDAWFIVPLVIIIVMSIYVFSARYVRKRIGTLKSLENLRRDY